jgi:RNA polymerase sigma-70 factor (ECF subfamily)
MKIEYIPDANWIFALKEGDLQFFSLLFDRYGKRLYHFALGYLKSAEDAEEVVQEVFLKIWDNRAELSAEKSLESVLLSTNRSILGSNNSIGFLRYRRFHSSVVDQCRPDEY